MTDLLAMGLSPELAAQGCLALIDYILGSVFFDSASAGERAAIEGDVEHAGLAAVGVRPAAVTSDEVFRAAVDLFLDGLAHRAAIGR